MAKVALLGPTDLFERSPYNGEAASPQSIKMRQSNMLTFAAIDNDGVTAPKCKCPPLLIDSFVQLLSTLHLHCTNTPGTSTWSEGPRTSGLAETGRPASFSKSRSDSSDLARHSLLDTLHAFQALNALLVQHIGVKLLHHLHHNHQAFEEPVHRDAQHARGRGPVVHLQDASLGLSAGVLWSRGGVCGGGPAVDRVGGRSVDEERGFQRVVLQGRGAVWRRGDERDASFYEGR